MQRTVTPSGIFWMQTPLPGNNPSGLNTSDKLKKQTKKNKLRFEKLNKEFFVRLKIFEESVQGSTASQPWKNERVLKPIQPNSRPTYQT
jgi:hypothetical protein